ncbi:Na+:solute symporter [Sulfidibacter corallicola]|uniref:Na+:solute symporter n=1 Tax=Sulfidibacter corallicola TaxID=2818388 RepID=A0A8A4TQZ1_SULCO|nr:sodium:solute symporter family protein [Sulfidibacter corallicola]QTD51381.1 Na+:solute symporter [Sulfidibacter corallicola]
MAFSRIDWFVFLVLIAVSLGINVYFFRRGNKSLQEFFLGGRNLPWFVAGISMVATTFAADTPLAVTEIVAENGISGNWLWWNALAGGMLTTFFFSHLWSRSRVLTEAEFIELRYSGKSAAFLRGFKAVYLGFFMNILILGWVNLAMVTILQVFFGLSEPMALFAVFGAMAFTAAYSTISGLTGIAVSDVFQFFFALFGCLVLAFLVVSSPEVGGITGLKHHLASSGALEFFPRITSVDGMAAGVLALPVGSFFAFIAMQWWASWYPGAEPGGGGYVAQRMMSTKNEKDAFWASLIFNIFHYCVRPWPWILVALSTLILYPDLGADERRFGYVMAMRDFLPAGLKGLLMTTFFAAYMSTVSTQLNWGSSYLVNDLYKRFFNPKANDRNFLKMARVLTVVLMGFSLIVTSLIESITDVWIFIFQCGAGLGLVLILRWYYWRINAWSEITATIAPFVLFSFFHFTDIGAMISDHLGWGMTFVVVVLCTTLAWYLVTHWTRPVDASKLIDFYVRVRPNGWWKPVDKRLNISIPKQPLAYSVICWVASLAMVYGVLFLVGKVIFREWYEALAYTDLALAGFLVLRLFLPKTDIYQDSEELSEILLTAEEEASRMKQPAQAGAAGFW